MGQQKICVIRGDGVGKEVIPAAAKVLSALGLDIQWVEAEAGYELFRRSGEAIPDATLAAIAEAGVALFGATSSPSGGEAGYRSPILVLRRTFDLYANLRPVKSLPGSFSRPAIDLLVVRENTQGLYSGRERRTGDSAIAERLITVQGSERIARVAYQQAALRQERDNGGKIPAGHVTIVHKANVLKVTDGLFRQCCFRIADQFPQIETSELLVDAAAMRLVRDPQDFDVLVTTNLFGDILSDEASALIGGLGVAPSANIGPHVAVFEPVHGSAPDIAGQGIANPVGAILSSAMLLEHIGHANEAQRVRDAVHAALADGVLSADLGGSASTRQVTAAILQNL